MMYRKTNGDIAKALFLSDEQVSRIDDAMQNALSELEGNGSPDWSVDEMIHLIAFHLHTPEEAFYAGLQCMAMATIANNQNR